MKQNLKLKKDDNYVYNDQAKKNTVQMCLIMSSAAVVYSRYKLLPEYNRQRIQNHSLFC